jgi:multicomponent K+:H+ antiporter subunit G
MTGLADALVAGLLLAGGGFALIGSFGFARLSDFFMRVHGPTKATTLGVGSVLAASSLHFSVAAPGLSLHELLVAGFLVLTAPMSAHLVVKAALHLRRAAEPPAPPEDEAGAP